MRLGKSEFFGERALLKNEPRAANVIGVGYVDCLVLERSDFINLLGPLQPILEREADKRGQVIFFCVFFSPSFGKCLSGLSGLSGVGRFLRSPTRAQRLFIYLLSF